MREVIAKNEIQTILTEGRSNIEKYKVGDLIKGAEVKGYSSFGAFFNVKRRSYWNINVKLWIRKIF